jgi:predicted permease
VISDGYWARRFGRRPDIIGTRLVVDGRPVTIVGVTAAGFEGLDPGRPRDLTLPLSMRLLEQPRFPVSYRTWIGMPLVARLRAGVSPMQATAALETTVREFLAEPPNRDLVPEALGAFALVPASRGSDALRQRYERALAVLAGMVALVLLIACVNVANLQLVRGAARMREIAVRMGLGGTRLRVARQLIVESVLLAACGGLLGALIGAWGTRYVAAVLRLGRNPTLLDLSLNATVLVFTGTISIAAGVLFGVIPAVRATRADLTLPLKEAASPAARRAGGRRLLVAAQLAICLVLVFGAGLLVRTLQNLHRIDAGFRSEGVLLFSLDGIGGGAPAGRLPALCAETVERLRGANRIRSGSCSTSSPVDTSYDFVRIGVPGRAPAAGDAPLDASAALLFGCSQCVMMNAVSPEYFSTLGIDLVAGRAFSPADAAGSPPVAIVSESAARHFFDDPRPIGRAFTLGNGAAARLVTIVGVARDARALLREPPPRMVYTPLTQLGTAYPVITVALHAPGDPAALAATIRADVAAVDKAVVVDYVRSMDQQIEVALVRERLLAGLATAFGALALVLSCVGLYGVVSYDVTRRTREIGIRAAVGATRGDLRRAVLFETLTVAGAGTAAGLLVITLVARRVIDFIAPDYLFGLTATDPRVIVSAAVALCATALLAGYVPARRASLINPAVALRE